MAGQLVLELSCICLSAQLLLTIPSTPLDNNIDMIYCSPQPSLTPIIAPVSAVHPLSTVHARLCSSITLISPLPAPSLQWHPPEPRKAWVEEQGGVFLPSLLLSQACAGDFSAPLTAVRGTLCSGVREGRVEGGWHVSEINYFEVVLA